ncbi:signal peptidase I [Acidiferrimicrobium sp. IK]|uniref:signal peptidase I n=1 Tax=Acidiferrimicrobium sp. IK TaxID=2871700 RepID=UPI0021CAEA93|nr:signal peptidase I [Acidiferrimicrobium sp. IK]MCU4183767.1 signal peptidase I [Acidiferrimicrobium sp. IK]
MTSTAITRRRRTAEALVLAVIVVVVAVLVRSFVAEAYYIPSASMEPGLQINDRVVVSRLSYHLHAPRRGDVVVFKAPPGVLPPGSSSGNPVGHFLSSLGKAIGLVDDSSVLIKRVIALPGETVEGRNGRVYINGLLLREPYLAPGTLTSNFGPYRIPAGTLWVMGDNRGDSEDSRVFGAIKRSSVVGRAVWRVWPPTRLSFLTLPSPAL